VLGNLEVLERVLLRTRKLCFVALGLVVELEEVAGLVVEVDLVGVLVVGGGAGGFGGGAGGGASILHN
jgi:hypothetical protein